MAHSKHVSGLPPAAILEELGSVKDLLNRFDDNIEDILSRNLQPDIDIPLLSDVVPGPDGDPAAGAPPTATAAPALRPVWMPATAAANINASAAPLAQDIPAHAPDDLRDELGDELSDDMPDALREAMPDGRPQPQHELPARADGPLLVDLNSADIEELEQLVFSDDGPSLAGADQPRTAPAPTRKAALSALELLPHLVDDVVDAHIPRLKAELLARLRALIEHADEQRQQA